MDPKQQALHDLERAAKEKDLAKMRYHRAIEECVRQGVTNTGMAAVIGISETAVRNYRKRNINSRA